MNDQVEEYARYIGLDPVLDRDYMPLAREGLHAKLDPPWESATDPETKQIYYFKRRSGGRNPIVTWEHPKDEYYKQLATQVRREREARDYKDRLRERLAKQHSRQAKKAREEVAPLVSALKKARKLRQHLKNKSKLRAQNVMQEQQCCFDTDYGNLRMEDLDRVDLAVPSLPLEAKRKSKYALNGITSPILLQGGGVRRIKSKFKKTKERISSHHSKQSNPLPQKSAPPSICLRDGEMLNVGDLYFGDLEDLNAEDLCKTRATLHEYIREKNDEIITNLEKKERLQETLALLRQRANEMTNSLMNAVSHMKPNK